MLSKINILNLVIIVLKKEDRVFTNLNKQLHPDIKDCMERGDWQDTDKILSKGYKYIQQEIINSRLRGRGGAGFYTGVKWGFISIENKPKNLNSYLIINADESEPGSCKDRALIKYEPHKIIEGALIAAFAIQANVVYIYVRGEFYQEAKALIKAVNEAKECGFLGKNIFNTNYSCDIYIHRGAGAYICGEETALIESLTGRLGKPRNKPPFPASVGYCGCPTLINNIETIAIIPAILKRGAKWFSGIGTEDSKGIKIFAVSGDVESPCIVEESMGIPMRDLIDTYAGGVKKGWDNLLAVWPGGPSGHMLPKKICDNVVMSFGALHAVGGSFGTGCMIVLNKDSDIITATERMAYFYMHESCGQCTPCREGTGWMWRLIKKIGSGNAKKSDVDLLYEVSKKIEGNTICALADAATWLVQGLLLHFKEEMKNRCK